jgi:hypothetical protein
MEKYLAGIREKRGKKEDGKTRKTAAILPSDPSP